MQSLSHKINTARLSLGQCIIKPIPMVNTKNYFHDRSVLLLLVLNSALVLVGALVVIFRLDASKGSSYIVQYRANVGIDEFQTGSGLDMLSFVGFIIVTYTLSLFISHRAYKDRRSIALTMLMMASLLCLLAIIVSNALLVLR